MAKVQTRWFVGFVAGAGTAAMALACGSGPLDIPSVRSSYESGWSVPLPPAPTAYRVPPDRAWIPVHHSRRAETAPAAGDAAKSDYEAIAAAVNAVEGCTFVLLNATIDTGPGETTVQSALGVWVDLAGAGDPEARFGRIHACTVPLTTFAADDAGDTRGFHVGEATPIVDDPEAHYVELADRFVARQQAAAGVTGPGLHPEDRRCVPTGEVTVVSASLAGVELALDVVCRIPTEGAGPGT